jgi:methionine-S-sulfoxide reductase
MQRMASLSLSALAVFAGLSLGCESAKSAPPVVAKPAIDPNGPREVAILAGGCFWGMEKVLREAPGVVAVEVGYAGGKSTKVSYEGVSEGGTGHAESVRIVFDPHQLSYEDLLAHWFFRGHDPTTLDRQNNDVGPQYRSEIFTTSEDQRRIAEAVKARVDRSGKWKRPIVTRIEPATTWVRAEEVHQDYLIKHPDGYNDHWLRDFDF